MVFWPYVLFFLVFCYDKVDEENVVDWGNRLHSLTWSCYAVVWGGWGRSNLWICQNTLTYPCAFIAFTNKWPWLSSYMLLFVSYVNQCACSICSIHFGVARHFMKHFWTTVPKSARHQVNIWGLVCGMLYWLYHVYYNILCCMEMCHHFRIGQRLNEWQLYSQINIYF